MRATVWSSSHRARVVMATLGVLTVVGLAVDAWVHLDLASTFDPIRTATLSQGDLFRVEAVLAVVAAAGLVVRPRRYTAAFAFLVAAGGAFAVLLYQYVDVGKIGPLPDMFDPYWSTEKALSLIGEAGAALTALGLLVLMQLRSTPAAPAPAQHRAPTAAPTVVGR